ncbi:MAG: hypothetical protein H0W19_07755 [Nitrosopumilus sp.]|nr:hypothetical protein [Nitrosopumilus sp.]
MDLSFFPDYLISIITDSIEVKQFLIKDNYVTDKDKDNINTISAVFEFHGSIKEFEGQLTSILLKNSIKEYVIAQDMEKENTIAILKSGDLRQLGILVCDFCGALFHSEDEKYIHQRAHYFY